jgi:heme exporter protein B
MTKPARLLTLLRREWVLELRRKAVLGGLALYLLSLVFISYLTFALQQQALNKVTWAALFWLTVLFAVVNTVAKSFIGERRGLFLYLYTLAPAQSILLAKLIYNTLLSAAVALAGYGLFSVFIFNPVHDRLLFLLIIVLASGGLAASLTLVSAIASRAANSNILMAVLGFPVVISVLLVAVRATRHVLDGLERSASFNELLTLLAINAIAGTMGYILFPYIWRS